MPGGYLGVEIFFVLSGFLITSLLLQEWQRTGLISLKDFYLRRALRLGPALIVYLLLLSAYAFFFMRSENARQIYTGVLWTLSYVSNWVLAFRPNYPVSVLAITWSLAVEEQFYLVWPLMLFFLLRSKLGKPWVIFVILCVLLLVVLRRALLMIEGAPFYRLYYGTDTRADGLMLGCLAACLVSWSLLPRSRVFEVCMKVLASFAALFLAYLVLTLKTNSPSLFRGIFTLATLAIASILMVVVVWPESLFLKILKLAPLVWIGRISYGLYLWHWPVRGFVYGATTHPSPLQVIVAVFLSFAITSVSFYLIERPFLAWKKRLSHA